MKETMKTTSNSAIFGESIGNVNKEALPYLQNFQSRGVIGQVRQEFRNENKLHDDPAFDLKLRAAEGLVPDLVDLKIYSKFTASHNTATFITEGAIELLHEYHKNAKHKILLLDTTGGITRKTSNKVSATFHHVLLLPMEKPLTALSSGQTTVESYLIPIAEMITNESTGFAISCFLELVTHQILK
jgi:UDP-N-acetyl-D-mannosaminuronic acid transferase (WecB/TagA/CpsF family)